MTDAGLAKIKFSDTKDDYGRTSRVRKQLKIPQFLKQALMNSRKAWDNFNQLAPSYRRNYILWITTAKMEETRNKRLKEAITLLTQNRKLGMK
jgi:uncharacterized protein YdeI (YjbR/CyaY-like superfamily)